MRIRALYSTESADDMNEIVRTQGLRVTHPTLPILIDFSAREPVGYAYNFWTDEKGAWLEAVVEDRDYGKRVYLAPYGSFTRGEMTEGITTEITNGKIYGFGLTSNPVNHDITAFDVIETVDDDLAD